MKSKTIDQVCGKPEGSFMAFVEKQKAELREIERERKCRIAQRKKKI